MRLKIGFGVILLIGFALLLGSRRSYSPGPLMKGHQFLASNCAACHQPWGRASEVSNKPCMDCHGDLHLNEKHFLANLYDKNLGLIPPEYMSGVDDRLACLSCHTDHKGHKVVLAATSGANCALCHAHVSIDKVAAHNQDEIERLPGSQLSQLLLETGFSHSNELKLQKKYNHKFSDLTCLDCHQLREGPGGFESSVLVRSHRPGEAVVSPAPASATAARPIAAAATAPTSGQIAPSPESGDDYAKLWERVPATTKEIPLFTSFKHINAAFTHSKSHLTYECGFCHTDIETSKAPGDSDARKLDQCFDCHGKAPKKTTARAVNSTGAIAWYWISEAHADSASSKAVKPKPLKAQFKTCAECHDFHIHYASAKYPGLATLDFTRKPLSARSKPLPWRDGWLAGVLATIGGAFGVLLFVGWMTKPQHEHLQPRRGAPVPVRNPNYETNVKGLFIAGEATGIPAINDAMRSGQEAAMSIVEARKRAAEEETPAAKAADTNVGGSPGAATAESPPVYDVIVVGCGPAGMGAATHVKSKGLKYLVLEKLSVASTIQAYPRDKLVHATPLQIDDYDEALFLEGDDAKEQLVEHWKKIIEVTQLVVNEHEEVTDIKRNGDAFEVVTTKATHQGRTVLLAPGTRASPRHLHLRGETPERVFYSAENANQFQGKRILVVGGGNSGHEAAISLADPQLGNTVTFSYVTPKGVTVLNRERVSALVRQGRLTEMPSTNLVEIGPQSVALAPPDPEPEELTLRQWMMREGARIFNALYAKMGGRSAEAKPSEPKPAIGTVEIPNDIIFAMIGAGPPTEFFAKVGIEMQIKGR